MALIKTVRNKFDGQSMQAYHRLLEARLFFDQNQAEVVGVIYVSEDAYRSGNDSIGTFSARIPDLKAMMAANAFGDVGVIEKWLLQLPDFKGATEKTDQVAAVAQAAKV